MTEKKSLVAKLVEVATEVRNIEKSGYNDAQKYDFVSEADVVRKVMPELLKHGVIFYPAERKVVDVQTYQTRSGSASFLTTVESKWVFTDGSETLEVMTIGQGADTGDKGAYKGMTGDKKYAILQALGIATGDDPEIERQDERETTPQERRQDRQSSGTRNPNKEASEGQIKRMFALARNAGINVGSEEGKKTLQAIVLSATGKHSSKQLTMGDMDLVYKTLESDNPTAGIEDEGILADVVKITGGELVESVA